jgi:hypothetical protein
VVPDGREDLSRAAAFEIGRLLGLSQLSVVAALLRFRAEQFGAGRVRELLGAITGFVLPDIALQRIDLSRFTAVQFIGDLVRNPELTIGPRRPVADPGRPIDVRGELDEVIAQGLGFDLATVRRTAEQVGIVAALNRASVPLAAKRPDMEQLRTALDGELTHVIGVAAPVITRGPGAARRRGRPQAPPPRDALDELLDRATIDEEEAP